MRDSKSYIHYSLPDVSHITILLYNENIVNKRCIHTHKYKHTRIGTRTHTDHDYGTHNYTEHKTILKNNKYAYIHRERHTHREGETLVQTHTHTYVRIGRIARFWCGCAVATYTHTLKRSAIQPTDAQNQLIDDQMNEQENQFFGRHRQMDFSLVYEIEIKRNRKLSTPISIR